MIYYQLTSFLYTSLYIFYLCKFQYVQQIVTVFPQIPSILRVLQYMSPTATYTLNFKLLNRSGKNLVEEMFKGRTRLVRKQTRPHHL